MTLPQNISREKTLILGVDPGLSGALAFYCLREKKLVFVDDMPLRGALGKALKGGKQEICLRTLSHMVKTFALRTLGAVIEEVGARPGQGVVSMFRFGYAAGIIAGVVSAHDIPILPTKPGVWKSLMGLSSDKELSRQKACALFPSHQNSFKRAKDDGRAEAALLAYFGTRVFQLPPQTVSQPKTELDIFS
jgi:crossover junction endodeoxyribonuclease RuvC